MVKFLNDLEEKFLILLLLISTLLVFLNVVLRSLNASLHWIDEAARYMYLWMIWLGADFALREKRHLRIGMIADRIKGKARIALELLVLVLWFGFSVFLGYQGVKLVSIVIQQGQVSAAMQINMAWGYACVPCGAIFMAIRLFFEIRDVIRTGKVPEAL